MNLAEPFEDEHECSTTTHHYHSGTMAMAISLVIVALIAAYTVLAILRPDLVQHLPR